MLASPAAIAGLYIDRRRMRINQYDSSGSP
jgi:hypothetical protein